MRLNALIDRFEGRRVVVLGDLVADVFIHGEISRISREAPVLILSHRDTETVPGGAANAVHNLWALGARPLPVGAVGDDEAGAGLRDYFESRGIETAGIATVPGYRTPTKTRILAGAAHGYRQQVLRLDRGERLAGGAGLDRALEAGLQNADALLVSDYGYGAVSPGLVGGLDERGIPVTLDSRYRLLDYTGLTAATPNQFEVEAALGWTIGNDMDALEKAGRSLLGRLKHDALLITRGRDGMALFERRKKTFHVPIFGTDEIADVTGAGDTVIATFTLGLAAGADYRDAARLANCAGGIVVMKHGTQPVTRDELSGAAATLT